jgi:hypothetical protein
MRALGHRLHRAFGALAQCAKALDLLVGQLHLGGHAREHGRHPRTAQHQRTQRPLQRQRFLHIRGEGGDLAREDGQGQRARSLKLR